MSDFSLMCVPLFLKRAAANHRRESASVSRKASLQLGDTPDGLRDLGTLELMNRDLDTSSQLPRSFSTDSLCSVSSIGNNFGHEFTVGQLEVTLEFDGRGSALHVYLHQGKDLLEKEEENFPGCFIRVTLLPEELNLGVSKVSRDEKSRGSPSTGRERRKKKLLEFRSLLCISCIFLQF